jgi:two-component system response regulator GlrR
MMGRSAAHTGLLERLAKIARADAEVLISGPTGVGKELYARYLHERSSRAAFPFVALNCGALPSDLFENELFGHVAGAFTGARPQSAGLVTEAEGGTLFLDEVDSLSLPNQVKLLRFVQEKEYRRLGDCRLLHADVRIVAATNADLMAAVKERRFREDLFFRLRVIPVEVPPLCERPDDILPIIDGYVRHYADIYHSPPIRFTAEALDRILRYLWPGNVRELENCIRYLTCLQLGHDVTAWELPLLEADAAGADPARPALAGSLQEAKRVAIERIEREYMELALRAADGNIARAARLSGKARRAFFELMRKHGMKAANYAA